MESVLLFTHVLGAVIFLGNIIVTFFWKLMANRSNDPTILAFSQRMVTKTDRIFTALGATLLAASGYAYAAKSNMLVAESWLLWAQVTFYASAVLWVLILVPIQHQQSKLALEFGNGSEIPERYWQLSRNWNLVGAIAVALPAFSLYLMVTKPML